MTRGDLILDDTPRRAFTSEEINDRKSNEPVYSPIGPRTLIKGMCDSKGSLMSAQNKSFFNRLAKIHRSLNSSFERNLWIAIPNLQRLQSALNLSDAIKEDALRYYSLAVKKKLTLGRTIDILLAAAIFTSVRVHNLPKTIEEICEAADQPKKRVVKAYRLIVLYVLPELGVKVNHFGPKDYVTNFCNALNVSHQVRNYSIMLLKKSTAASPMFEGKDPKGLAAAAIYLMCKKFNEVRTQSEIAQVAHITEVTLRMRAQDLKKFLLSRKMKA
jgi:transcription initiation factor TFIIB